MNLIDEMVLAPQIVSAEEGLIHQFGPEKMRVILPSAATGGAFTLAEATIDAAGFGPPYHVHEREDETFTVLEGELIVIVDGVRHVLKPGDTAFAPRNVPHRFESGPNGVRFYAVVTGGNFEKFFPRYLAALSAGDFQAIPGIAAEHGISLLPEG